MNVNTTAARTKIVKLTLSNVSALEGWAEDLKVDLGKTTATFEGTAKEAASRVRTVQEKIAVKQGRRGGSYASLHAVARKLENGDCTEIPAPTATVEQGVENAKQRLAKVQADPNRAEVAPAEDAPAESPETAKLELVVDSTDKSANPGGVFGKSIPQAVAEEKAKRGATETTNADLKKVTKLNASGDDPAWGTAKTHGLKDGDLFMYYGSNREAPKKTGTVRKYEMRTGGNSNMGGYASRFWFARIVPITEQQQAAAAKKATAAPKADKAAPKPETAAPAKKAAPAKPAPKIVDGVAYGTSGPACHALKVGDKFLYHGDDKKAPAKVGKKLTLQITDRIWIEGVDSKGKVVMHVHIAKSFWATKA